MSLPLASWSVVLPKKRPEKNQKSHLGRPLQKYDFFPPQMAYGILRDGQIARIDPEVDCDVTFPSLAGQLFRPNPARLSIPPPQ